MFDIQARIPSIALMQDFPVNLQLNAEFSREPPTNAAAPGDPALREPKATALPLLLQKGSGAPQLAKIRFSISPPLYSPARQVCLVHPGAIVVQSPQLRTPVATSTPAAAGTRAL
jgi:hypothetical protein